MIEIYTDGSCLKNPGPGGWGVLIRAKNQVKLSGGEQNTTNNRMEMKAIIEALQWLKKFSPGQKAVLYSDSRLLVSSLNQGWKRKQNLDLWRELDNSLSGLEVEFKWVKAHADNRFNNLVDELAQREARKIKQKAAETKYPTESRKQNVVAVGTVECDACGNKVLPRLGLMPDFGYIREDCPRCGNFFRFASKSAANLKIAAKRVLLSKKEQTSYRKMIAAKGLSLSDKQLKSISKKEIDGLIGGQASLF